MAAFVNTAPAASRVCCLVVERGALELRELPVVACLAKQRRRESGGEMSGQAARQRAPQVPVQGDKQTRRRAY